MSEIRVDTISEKTSANGVAIDGVTIKDGGIAATDGSTITTADNTDTLTLISTDADANQGPVLNFKRDSSSPADDDILGQLTFTGENSASEAIEFVRIRAGMVDVTDGTEDSRYNITTYTGGSQFGRLNIEALETVFNENSTDVDFRVESNGNANMLFVDGGNDRVGVGTASPTELLHLKTSNAETSLNIEGGANQSGSLYGSIEFKNTYGGASADTVAKISGIRDNDQTASHLAFYSKPYNGSINERLRLHSGGVLSASQGIALGVGTANTASNVLDDYEEGTFTPTLNSTGSTFAYTTQLGAYTKIGNAVTFYIKIQLDGGGNSFSANGVSFIGLPFSSANVSARVYKFFIAPRLVDLSSAGTGICANLEVAGNTMSIVEYGDNTALGPIAANQLSSSSGQLHVTGTYYV